MDGLPDEPAELCLQGAVTADALAAFPGFCWGEGFSGAFPLEEAGPAIIGAVELGRFGFAGAVGFAASAGGGGETARQQREGDVEGEGFLRREAFLCWHVS